VASDSWYRVVRKDRKTREEVLTSKWGRFHDNEPTTYLADTLETAWREVTAALGAAPANPAAFRGWLVTLAGAKLADLRDPKEQASHQITEAELLADPAPPQCKDVARKLRLAETGYHGVIYRSVRNQPDGACVVAFLERANDLITVEPLSSLEWRRFVREILG